MYRLYVDMDGTVTEYRKFQSESQYEQKGYYASLRPIQPVIDALWLVHSIPSIEIFIISACPRKGYAKEEKNDWLDKYLSFIDMDHRIFSYIGENKADYIGKVEKEYFLYDDYKTNLNEWVKSGGSAIKSLNGINSEPENNQYSAIAANCTAESIAEKIKDIIINGIKVNDHREEVQLRNEKLGLTMIIDRKKLGEIVSLYFDEYKDVEDFRKNFNIDDWNFVRRVYKDVTIENNTSVQQFRFEFETFYNAFHTSYMKIIDAYKSYKFAIINHDVNKKIIESKIMNTRGSNKMVSKLTDSLDIENKESELNNREWRTFYENAIEELNKSVNSFFEKYNEDSLCEDEGFDTTCKHAKEQINMDMVALRAAIDI